MSDESTGKKFLTPAEVSSRYSGRVNVRTLANWRNRGCGPAYAKIGGKVLYPLDKIVEWEARNTVQSTSQYTRSK